MGFEKIKFEKIINNNEVQHIINGKYVTKSTYESLLNDESLFVLPPLPKIKVSPENSIKTNGNSNSNNNNHEETTKEDEDEDNIGQCDCEQCQELRLVISDIREMDDNEALEGLKYYIEAVRTKTHLESVSQVYEELGNSMIKVSSQLDVQLEDFLSQFDVLDDSN